MYENVEIKLRVDTQMWYEFGCVNTIPSKDLFFLVE